MTSYPAFLIARSSAISWEIEFTGRCPLGISPLAIGLDTFDRLRGQGKTPRLGIVFERAGQYGSFLRSPFNFDKGKQQAIAVLFTESLWGADLRAMFGLPGHPLHAEVRADEIFVYFEDFERVAKWEVHDLVTSSELKGFTASLDIGDQFWCIQRYAGPPIVFVKTDEQARALANAGELGAEVGRQGVSLIRLAGYRAWLGKQKAPSGETGYPALSLMALAETGIRALIGAVFGPG